MVTLKIIREGHTGRTGKGTDQWSNRSRSDDTRSHTPARPCLVLRREGEDRVLRTVHLTARRPVCDREVTIEKGRRQRSGRLASECSRNPVEHTYSFDFITCKGRQLW